jgi:hypothetical protein
MGATEQRLLELAHVRGLRLDRQVCVAGLSSRGHLDPSLAATASARTLGRLGEIFERLGGDSSRLAAKRAVPLRLDFHAPELGLFIEVDETQHFTTERAHTFESYDPDIRVEQVEEYRRLIEVWKQDADRYRASKPAVDFPRHAGRRAQRAYLDAVRDLAAAQLGIRLLRIPAPERDAALAFLRLEQALAASSSELATCAGL